MSRLIPRSLIFAALFLWMAGGPLVHQVFDVRNRLTRYVRPWEMFSARGIGFAEARFLERLPDGTLRELDRFRLLGYRDRRKAPLDLRRIPSRSTRDVAHQLCGRLGPGADVRAIARVATVKGWVRQYDGSEPLCPTGPREGRGR